MAGRLELGLLANAFDYLLSAAEQAKEGKPRSYKYALVHLATGIELLLKARLKHEHWSLLFEDVDKATQVALASGKFRSVDFATAVKRLERIANIKVSGEQLRHLGSLRDLRNRAIHFELAVDEDQVKAVIARGCNLALDFYHQNLEALEPVAEPVLEVLHENLRKFQDFVQVRLAAVADQLRESQDIMECPRCWQETLVIGDGDPHCPFCQHEVSARELAEQMNEVMELEVCPSAPLLLI